MPQTLRELTAEYYTVDEAQELLDRSRQQIYTYAKENHWRGKKWRGLRFFFKPDVERMKEELSE